MFFHKSTTKTVLKEFLYVCTWVLLRGIPWVPTKSVCSYGLRAGFVEGASPCPPVPPKEHLLNRAFS